MYIDKLKADAFYIDFSVSSLSSLVNDYWPQTSHWKLERGTESSAANKYQQIHQHSANPASIKFKFK